MSIWAALLFIGAFGIALQLALYELRRIKHLLTEIRDQRRWS